MSDITVYAGRQVEKGGGGVVLNELEALSCFCSSTEVLSIHEVENSPLIQNKGSMHEMLPRKTDCHS